MIIETNQINKEIFEEIIKLGMDDLMEMIKANRNFDRFEKILNVIPDDKKIIKTMFLETIISEPKTSMLFTHIATDTLINIIVAKLLTDKKREEKEMTDESSN